MAYERKEIKTLDGPFRDSGNPTFPKGISRSVAEFRMLQCSWQEGGYKDGRRTIPRHWKSAFFRTKSLDLFLNYEFCNVHTALRIAESVHVRLETFMTAHLHGMVICTCSEFLRTAA